MAEKPTRKTLFLTEGQQITMEGKGQGTIKRAKRLSPTVILVGIAFPSGPIAGYIGQVVNTDDKDEEE
jgi:hypothetical protein